MRSKKLLSLVLVLCMILPLLPAFATEGTITETNGNITMIYSNDFDENIDGWVKGAYKNTGNLIDLRKDSFDGASVMAIEATITDTSSNNNTCPYAYLDFDDIEFTDGNKIVIETRFKQTGDGNGNAFSYLKYNRLNTDDMKFSYTNAEGEEVKYTYAQYGENSDHLWNMLRMNGTSLQSRAAKFVDADTINNWTDVRIVIDEKTQKYNVYTKTGDVKGSAENVSIATNSVWELQCFDGSVTGYDSLDSLTFFMRRYTNTLYVDYFRVYEATPVYADAQILGGSTVEAGKAAEIQFINVSSSSTEVVEAKVGTVPEGAVTITNAAGTALKVVQTYDADNQIVSVKPEGDFVKDETYTIALNETALSSVGLTCRAKSTKSFTVYARGPRSKGLVINDDFDGTEATDYDGWVAAEAVEGYAPTLTRKTLESGETVLEVKTTKVAADGGKTAGIFKRAGNGIAYDENKNIIIKTRIMGLPATTGGVTADGSTAGGGIRLAHNRPYAIADRADSEYGHAEYMMARVLMSSGSSPNISHSTGRLQYVSDVLSGGLQLSQLDIASNYKVGTWVDLEISYNGKTEDITHTFTYTNTSDVVKTVSSSGAKVTQTKDTIETEFGKDTTKTAFDALDSLTFYLTNGTDGTDTAAYIDYIQVYEEDAVATAAMSKTQYKKGEVPAVVFTTDMEIDSIPEGAVTTEGFEATPSFDAASKTLTLTPNGALKAGTTYTVKLDKAKLEEAGMFYTGAETLKFSYIGNYVIYDTFDVDLGSWVKGATKASDSSYSLERITLEDDDKTTVMALSSTSTISNGVGSQPNAYSKFGNKINFTSGNKIVIKTRVKQAGDADGAAFAYLKYNRPNITVWDTTGTHGEVEMGANWYTMLRMHHNKFNITGGGTYGTDVTSTRSIIGSDDAESYLGDWMDVEIVIDEAAKKYTVYATVEKTNSDPLKGEGDSDLKTQALAYTNAGIADTTTGFTSLDSLTFLLREKIQSLYVDYISVYEIVPFNAQAQILGGSTVEAGKEAEIQFINVKDANEQDVDIDELPEGAVTINGTATVQSWDAESKTVSVKPEGGFVAGTPYTIAFDTDVLATIGMTCTGTKSFTVTGRGARSTGLVINDDFNGTEATDYDGWVAAEAAEGYAPTLTRKTLDSGETVLEVKTSKAAVAGDGKTAGIFKRVGNGMAYDENKNIIIKTRIMGLPAMTNGEAANSSTAGGGIRLAHNRPYAIAERAGSEYGQAEYVMARVLMSSGSSPNISHSTGRLQYVPGVYSDGNQLSQSDIASDYKVGTWVDLEISYNGKTEDITHTFTYTNTSDVVKTVSSKNAKVTQTKDTIETEFGKKTTKTAFDALDSLTFYLTNGTDGTDTAAYIDYVQVYEEDAVVDIEVKDTIRYDEAFKIEFNTTGALENVDGIVSVEGLEGAEQRYDAATKTLTIIPAENLTVGSTYNVSIDKNALAELGLLYEGDASYTVKIRDNVILHDTFENGNWGNWKIGAIKNPSDSYTYAVEDGVLKLETAATLNNDFCDQPNLVNDFADVDFSADRNIIIEAKIKQTGNGASPNKGISYLKYNRPDKTDFKGDHTQEEMGSHWYTLVRFDTDKLQHQHISNSFGTTAFAENEDFTNQWIDIKVIINGANKTYTVTATTENGGNYEGASKLYTAPNAYTCAGVDPNKGFTSLNSLTFMLREYVNKLHIDEIKVYEDEISDIYAIMPEGNTVEAGDSIDFTFYGKDVIDSIPAGAVKIDGANATYTAFADNTLSIKPATGEFAENGTYTVTIDAEALESAGMDYIGTTSFTVTGRGARETTGISDNFAGDKDSWYEGASADGYSATATPVTDSGAKDGNALKIDFPARGTVSGTHYTDGSQYGSVTKKLGNGFELNKDTNVVIETRVKKTSADGYFDLKINRPDTLIQLTNDQTWHYNYSLFINYSKDWGTKPYNGIYATNGVFSDAINGISYQCPQMQLIEGTETFDSVNKWVTYKQVLNYAEKKIYTTISYTDDNGEEVVIAENVPGDMIAPRWSLDAIHGKGAFELVDRYYTSLDRLTFTSTNDCEIYVDYVNVYTTTSVDEKISAKLTTDGVNGIDSFVEGDTVKPVFELQPKDGVETTYYAISAKYVDGKLADTHIEKITTTGKTHTDETGYTIGNEGNVVIKAFVWSESFVPLCTAAEAASNTYTVYVRTNGDDNATGASDAPVASLEKALEIVYESDADAAKIVVGGGNYKVASTIEIPKNAAIPANGLTIKNAEGEEAIFVGGNTYTGESAALVTAEDAIYERLPEAAQGKVYKLALGMDVAPVSYPGVPEYSMRKAVNAIDNSEITLATSEVSFDGELGTIARWPNVGEGVEINGVKTDYAKIAGIYDGDTLYESTSIADYVDSKTGAMKVGYAAKADFGPVNSCDESKATYETDVAAALAKIENAETKAKTGVNFKVDNTKKRVSDWESAVTAAKTNPENSPLIFGYWLHDWATQTMPLGSVDTTNNAVTTKYASWYGAKTGARYYVFNLLEELDKAGEYYIDRSPEGNDVLYFYSESAPNEANKITISTLGEKSQMLKVSSVNAKVVIDGLIFESSRGSGIALSAARNATVQNCTIRNIGAHGISVYAKNCNVLNNDIYDTNGGIIVGNEDATNDPKNLTLANNLIHGNTIKRFSRLNKVYVDAINLGGVGNTASYNHISEGEHLAARVTGNFNTFEYNEITNVLNETDDAGAIYMGRSWTQRGNKILSNYIHDLAINNNEVGAGDSPVAGIFLDDHYAGAYIEGNVFANINGHGVRTNRGRENTITNNLFVNCTKGGTAVASNLAAADNLTTDDDFFTQYNNIESYMRTGVWYEKFSEINDTLLTDWAKPEKNVVTNNYAVKCGGTGIAVGAWPTTLGTVSGNDSVAADSEIEAGAYGVDAAKTGITGFKTIEFANMRK